MHEQEKVQDLQLLEQRRFLNNGRNKIKKKAKRKVSSGVAHIKASFNNTIINIADSNGETIAWTSGGSVGFKGSRKSTPYAAKLLPKKL